MEFFKKILQSRYFWPGLFVAAVALGIGVVMNAPATQQATLGLVAAGVGAFFAGLIVAFGIDGAPPSLSDALRDALGGRMPVRPAELPPQIGRLWDELGDVALKMQRAAQLEEQTREREGELRRQLERLEQESSRLRADLEDARSRGRSDGEREDVAELRRRIAENDRGRDEAQRRLRDAELAREDAERKQREASAELERLHRRVQENRSYVQEAERVIADHVDRLSAGFGEQMAAVEQTISSMQEISAALHQIAQHVEALASNAEESSSSILEMTATNDEVAENMANLANSVRETVSSIEEMTYSIKEVARNVDALSLTAEETSSSMNQMDVSIDQVQSNANETARLSEEVAVDAERGAEAILKTIDEINRIKETSSEAVQVISTLGSRIEAIGDILNVIDDVAEQTNLLALNAAIIAAQAGEHGKGFAVVADEIKDLAERAGASTKEIADLIKTIQAESKKGIAAVQLGAATVDRGVEVSAEAERALKNILSSSQKSTSMVRAIARATVEQAKGSKQVTDAIGRIAETVQQIAAATAEQARGSELIMKSAEKMRLITQHVERSSQEQARGGRQISQAIENISGMVNELHQSQRAQARGSEQTLSAAKRIHELTRAYEGHVRELSRAAERLRTVARD
jgi:methyl-accepting chemotaxis protein